jgi:hypothetical protein
MKQCDCSAEKSAAANCRVYCDQVYSWESKYTEGVHAIVALVTNDFTIRRNARVASLV